MLYSDNEALWILVLGYAILVLTTFHLALFQPVVEHEKEEGHEDAKDAKENEVPIAKSIQNETNDSCRGIH